MGFFGKINRSADLASGMADRRGVDLAARILEHPETEAQAFRSMLMRCAFCEDQDSCATLQAGCDHLDAAPDYCRNKGLFDGSSI